MHILYIIMRICQGNPAYFCKIGKFLLTLTISNDYYSGLLGIYQAKESGIKAHKYRYYDHFASVLDTHSGFIDKKPIYMVSYIVEKEHKSSAL